MMSFEVQPYALKNCGRSVGQIASAIPIAQQYVTTYCTVQASSGLTQGIAEEMGRIRDVLVGDYTPSGAGGVFTSAGAALEAMARDYEGIDEQQRERYDGQLPGGHEYSRPRGMDAEGETAGISLDEFRALLVEPSADSFEAYERWKAIRAGVDYILGWDWLFNLLGFAGMPNLGQRLNESLAGDWEAAGRAVGALEGVAGFWDKIRAEQAALLHDIDKTWSGNAANATFEWFSNFDDTLYEHESALSGVASRINSYIMGVREAIDGMCGLINSLVNLLAPYNPKDIVEGIIKGTLEAVMRKVFMIVDLLFALIDACFVLVGLIAIVMSNVQGRDPVNFPDATAFAAPDVNGP